MDHGLTISRIRRYTTLCTLLCAAFVHAAGEAKTPPPAKAEAPATHTAKKGPISIEVKLDGVFEAQTMTEIVIRLEEWSTLKVKRAVSHGSLVKEGTTLVSFELEDIDRALADFKRANELADIALTEAELDLNKAERSLALDLAAAERTDREAAENLKRYLRIDRPLAVKAADWALRYTQQRLEYQEEELRQLEKMYKADELTEETEEIVLKRQRHAVESAKFSLEQARIRHDQTMKVTLPRQDVVTKEAARRAALAWEKAKTELPLAVKRQRLGFSKQKIERKLAQEKLEKLTADRKAMTVTAPTAGVVYYGRCVRGKWSDPQATAAKLKPRGTVLPGTALMTIVKPRPLGLRVSIPEKELHQLRPGVRGTCQPTAYPDLRLATILRRIAAIPSGGGFFDATFTVQIPSSAKIVMAGMGCSIKLITYQKKDAITVPPTALSNNERDKKKGTVYVVGKDGKQKKRAVTVGKRTDKEVEILKGLNAGENVLVKHPQ